MPSQRRFFEPGPGLVLALGFVISLPMLLHPTSFFSSPSVMAFYFGDETAPGSWRWLRTWSWEVEPFRYRLLFRAAVDLLAEGFDLVAPRTLATYWTALMVGCTATVMFALWAADRFLKAAGYAAWTRFLLLLAWIALPPFHLGFAHPVQTKEDFLAYGLLFIGLRAILKGDDLTVVICTGLGVLTRETLLILPGVYLLASAVPLWRRYGLVLAALAGHLALRAIMGSEGYQVTRWEHFDGPFLVPISIFFIFGYAWLALLPTLRPGLLLRGARSWFSALIGRADGPVLERLRLAGPAVLAILLILHLFMGRIVEIRITALAAPWVLMALAPYATPPFDRKTLIWAIGAALAGAAVILALWLRKAHVLLQSAWDENIPFLTYTVWIGETHLQAALLAALAVFMWRERLSTAQGGARLRSQR